MGPGLCPNCHQGLPRAVVESTLAQLVNCQRCHFRLLWGNGRVLRALPPPDHAAPSSEELELPPGTANGVSHVERGDPGTVATATGAGIPLREGVVEASVQVAITPTAVTRRPPLLPARSEPGRGDEPSGRTSARRGAEVQPGRLAVPETMPSSNDAITAPSVVPAPAALSARSREGIVSSPPDAVTAPSVEASRTGGADDDPGPPVGGLARRLLPIAAVGVVGGLALVLLSSRTPSPSMGGLPGAPSGEVGSARPVLPAPGAASGPVAGVLPSMGPSGGAALPGPAPEPVAAAAQEAPAEGATQPGAPSGNEARPEGGAPAPLTAAQRKEAKRRAVATARKLARLRRAEKRRLAAETKRRQQIERREEGARPGKVAADKRATSRTARPKKGTTTRRKRPPGTTTSDALPKTVPAEAGGSRLASSPSPDHVCRRGRKVKPARRGAGARRHAKFKRGRAKGARGKRSRVVRIPAAPTAAAPDSTANSLPVREAEAVSPSATSSTPAPAAPPPGPALAGTPSGPAETQVAEAMAVARARNSCQAGHARFFAGDFPAAERYYRQSLSELPSYAASLRGLGLVLSRQGRAEDAVEAYSRYLALAPRARDAWLVRRRIEQLRRPAPPADRAAPPPG